MKPFHKLGRIISNIGERPILLIPFVTIAIFLLPIAFGMIFVTATALAYPFALAIELPEKFHQLLPLWAFFTEPGVGNSIIFTLLIGVSATLLAWGINCLFLALLYGSRLFQLCQKFLSPILAMPHITLAVGLIFLLAPSGIIARLLAPLLGFAEPPFWRTNPDPYGFVLVLGLVMKELPFLFLLSLSALERISFRQMMRQAQTLGYSRAMIFIKHIYPLLYAQMRLPIFVVLAFSLAIVDMALILAPHAPPMLGVKILQWAYIPDLSYDFLAAAGAFWLFMLIITCITIWLLAEKILRIPYHHFRLNGWRGNDTNWLFKTGTYTMSIIIGTIIMLSIGSMLMLVIWSVSGLWSFPDLIPSNVSLKHWGRALMLMQHALPLTLLIAIIATSLSMMLVIGCLEAEQRYQLRPQKMAMLILYLPLLMPQISFLFGVQILLIKLGWHGTLWVVILGHMIFVLPYIYLSLAGPWHKLASEFRFTAASLSKSPMRTLWQVILPMQLSPLLTAFALGVAVSIALYLPTYLLGSGNFTTLTTEAITLSSGGNRRIVSVYGLVQLCVPLIFFSIAVFLPRFYYQNRRDMNV